jgi:DNA-binding IclR family transcriptional regulator
MAGRPAEKTKPTATTTGGSVPAAARTMALFEVFARERRELTKSELARLLDLPESSCSDLLNTLYELGYVARTVETKRYYPTARLLNAATAIAQNDPLTMFGTEAASLLSRKVNETCVFGVLDGDRVKVLAVYEGVHRLRYVVNVGDRVSIHGTALGKALLGALPPAERARVLRLQPLRRLTENTKTDVAKLEQEIERNQKHGWQRSQSEGAEGVWSLGIADYVGTTLVALSMIGPSDRMEANHEKFLEALLSVRKTLFSPDAASSGEAGVRRGRGRPRRL